MAKKKTDYIEEEAQAVDSDDDYVGSKMKAAQKILEQMSEREDQERLYEKMVQNRRWDAWEQASNATMTMHTQACKAMKRELLLRAAQVIALFCICIILIVK